MTATLPDPDPPSDALDLPEAAGLAGVEPSLAEVRAVIPRSAFQRSYGRAFAVLFVAVGSFVASVAFSAVVWNRGLIWLFPVAWFLTGTSLMALFLVGHDCAHNSFFPRRAWNEVVGHLVFLPLGYSYHGWRHVHDSHHRKTNALGKTLLDVLRREMDLRHDTAFVPMTRDEGAALARSSPWLLFVYRLTRVLPPFVMLLVPVSLSALFRSTDARKRRAAAGSSAFVIVAGGVAAAAIVRLTGSPWALLHFWIVPNLVHAVWFSAYAFLQHTSEEVPVFDLAAWTPYRGQFLGTINCRFPRWVSVWHADGDLHLPHHISTAIPSYRLREANAALKASKFGPLMKEVDFSFAHYLRQLRACHLWDERRGGYARFAELSSPPAAPAAK